jgi:putative flippase GtrA
MADASGRSFVLTSPFVRFLITGVANTAFGYAVYWSALATTHNEFVALTLSSALGVIFNFFSIGRVVFNSRDPRRLGRFLLTYVVVYAYNFIGLAILGRLRLDPAVSWLALLPGAVMLAWVLNSRFVFAAPRSRRIGFVTIR